MGDLSGRVVLVTGGSRGIGLGLARGAADAGAALILWGRDRRRLDAAVTSLEAGGARALGTVCDVADEAAVGAAFAEAVARMGGVDAIFANAGSAPPPARFTDLGLDDWRAAMQGNLEGTVAVLRAGARHMIERGEGGALTAVASIAALGGMRKWSAYAASKAAVLSLTRTLAMELGEHGIRSNALLPGWIDTDMTKEAGADLRDKLGRRTPVGRLGTPDDFARVAAFLADPTLTFHTGDAVIVDGGYRLR